ncbi:hypothetical protein VTN96DRAFT_4041 [Rasamsonia emersonii]
MSSRQEPSSPSLLSPAAYDEDVASLRSLSEQDSDSEDDELLRRSRSTLELAEHDRSVLEEEEETEKLLVRTGPAVGLRRIFSPTSGTVRIGKRERRKQRRRSEREKGRGKPYQEGDLMFEMEEGFRGDDSTQSSTRASSLELDRLALDGWGYKSKWAICTRYTLIFSAIVVLFLIIVLGAYKASGDFRSSRVQKPLLSNGTALFAPTTILISLDGFRADFLNRGLTPTLNSLIAEGVSPRYMLPSFPSVTFPNHFTLVTGLYPESHGIVGNSFWDPTFQEEFVVEPHVVSQPKWWKAEPVWVTAEKQGVRTAIHMWPGSEAHIGGIDPSFYDKFNGSETLSRKVDRILQFLDLPGEESDFEDEKKRPQLIAAYVPDVDAAGHKYGPNSTEIRSTIASADDMLASLLDGLQARNLTDIVNIVVVSDHGMATTSTRRLVQLEDLVDLDLVEHIDGWPLRGLRPKRPEDLQILQSQLAERAKNFSDGIEVYTRQTMPERYHFSKSERIAPLWVIPKTGWAVVERPEFDAKEALKTGRVYTPRGIHGYDNEHPLMRAIFIARGPAFPHQPNSRLEVFQNIEVYNIICDSIGVKPLPSNGTLRLPLQPVGLHDNEDAPVLDSPADPPTSGVGPERPGPITPDPSSTMPQSPGSSDNSPEDADAKPTSWWSQAKETWESFKEWVSELIQAKKDNRPPS